MQLCVGEGQLHTAQHEDKSSQQSKGRVYSHLLCTDEATSGIQHLFQMTHYKRNVNKVVRAPHRPLHGTGTCHVPGEAEGPGSVQPGEDKANCSRRCTAKGQLAMVLTGNRETRIENKEKNSHPKGCSAMAERPEKRGNLHPWNCSEITWRRP